MGKSVFGSGRLYTNPDGTKSTEPPPRVDPSSRGGVGDATAAETKAHYDKWGPNTKMKFNKSSDARGTDPATTIRTSGRTVVAPSGSAAASPVSREEFDAAVKTFASSSSSKADADAATHTINRAKREGLLGKDHPMYQQAEFDKALKAKVSSIAARGQPGGAGTMTTSVTGDLEHDNAVAKARAEGWGPGSAKARADAELGRTAKPQASGGGGGQPRVPAGNPDGGQWTDA